MNWQFFMEVFIGGLLAGVMYALVALGFVLIYKASGVLNFAQGAMVFFAALVFAGMTEHGMNFWLAIVATLTVMVVLAFAIELENMAIAAYADAVMNLTDPALMTPVTQIMANEGQHLVVLRQALGTGPVPSATPTGLEKG